MARALRGVAPGAAALVLGAACVALLALTDAQALSPRPAERPTAEQKRCAAAERRVARHRDGLAQLDVRLARDRAARETCLKTRACEQLDREIKSEEARRKRIAKQLAQFEDEAGRICAAVRPSG